jgi:hypothetical protein
MGLRGLFGVIGGPVAWFAQVCLGYLLASGPCFPGPQRFFAPPTSLSWTWPVLIALLIVCVLIALAAFLASWRMHRELGAMGEAPSTAGPSLARVRFVALWGMVLGAGFCVVTLLTVVAYVTLPRCAG